MERYPLIFAHRGATGGNIPANSYAAYQAALLQHADGIELDVSKSADGTLYVFHPKMEPAHLLSELRIPQLHDAEVDALRYVNCDNTATQFGVSKLDDIFEMLKGRCLINVDKFYTCMEDIACCIRRHGMTEQVIVKTNTDRENIDMLERFAPDLPYMAFIRREDTVSELLKQKNIRYMGAEVLFDSEKDPVASPEYIHRMHRLGLKVWVNAIVYDKKVQLAAGHSDDTSVCGDRDKGWGWLIDHGFDMIQTDWPGMLHEYMHEKF